MIESIGKRIAYLRQKYGWTQQSLADRVAMSRVAVSHIEMDLTIPSERSITLLAGVFKMTPIELVDNTTYPRAKAERLPRLTTTHTEVELNYALLKNDLDWHERISDAGIKLNNTQHILNKWIPILENMRDELYDPHETKILLEMQALLREINDKVNHPVR